jgi:hypothetical protein
MMARLHDKGMGIDRPATILDGRVKPRHDNKRELPLRRSLDYLSQSTESSIP